SVNSIFDAVHVLSTQAMPPNRPLGEYIVILNLLAKVFRRIIVRLYGLKAKPHLTSKTIGLLVCFVGSDNRLSSRAVVGFSAIGRSKKKQRIIMNRRIALPELEKVTKGTLDWIPGNCVECETFACYEDMCNALGNAGSEV